LLWAINALSILVVIKVFSQAMTDFFNMRRYLLQATLFLLVLVTFCMGQVYHATAAGAIQCHCFNNRDYNPTEKFAADAYILATSFNSLLARLAGLPKKQIIMIRMNQGVAQDDLLIGLKISRTTGQELQQVLDLSRNDKTWAEIIAGLSLQEVVNEDKTLAEIKAGLPVRLAGTRVADEMIADFFRVPSGEINKLRISGLNEKEITLILILKHVSEIQPEALVDQYKNQGRSWSEIAYNLGVQPKAAGRYILAYPSKNIAGNG
jgi:hypothetical protein